MLNASSLTRREALAGTAAALALSVAPRAAGKAEMPAKPLVFGHRGAPAHRPEHTLASYARAIADGADFVEPDLVATRDGVLVVRHENNLAETTDVSRRAEFAARKTTKTIDGAAVTGWFSEDFTLAELKTLRAVERLGPLRPESQAFDGEFEIVTFAEMSDFVAAEAATGGRAIGIIPELKHSTYFAGIGLPLEQRFLDVVASHRYLGRAPVIVQSFETGNLRWLRERIGRGSNLQLMQLTENSEVPADRAAAGDVRTWRERLDARGVAEVAGYADYLAPWNRDLIPLGTGDRLAGPGPLIALAHQAGLRVGTWTFRPENHFLPADLRDAAGEGARNPAGSIAEIRHYLAAGIDGFFTDDPALGRAAVDAFAGV